ncbi:MFS transporter [Pseudonocardia sp. TRM90224]|uniref:MFS transporter n=1 Tax=Pseudonocardia sp. TRM90224 TaxID=2812678 RepID=UPI001E2CD698|nr:MFS transporter [Pseudonocardia sp. TRM90224]
MAETQKSPTPSRTPPSTPTLLGASLVGTSIEWYDYYIFGTATALVFGPLFYQPLSDVGATFAAFATFAVGFFARPVGAAVIGHYGDRIGRRSMLVLTLLTTGLATTLIGVLPTYAAIGIGAPILLVALRVLQGFGLGGEWGGAVLIATEHAEPRRRALFGSFAQFGVPVGVLTSNLAFLALAGLSMEELLAWGWRLPFLFSIVLVVVGLLVRARLADSPEFEKLREEREVAAVPFTELLRTQPRELLLASVASIAVPAVGYTVIVYILNYGTKTVGYDRNTLLLLILASTAVWIAAIAGAAVAADRFGGRRVYVLGALTAVLWPIPMFLLVDSGNPGLAFVAFAGAAIVQGLMAGSQGGWFTEIFDLRVRYSGISVAYQIGGMVGGAVTPLVATSLQLAGGSLAVALYLAGLSLLSLVAAIMLRPRPAG